MKHTIILKLSLNSLISCYKQPHAIICYDRIKDIFPNLSNIPLAKYRLTLSKSPFKGSKRIKINEVRRVWYEGEYNKKYYIPSLTFRTLVSFGLAKRFEKSQFYAKLEPLVGDLT